jgi:hypothetical protein
MAGKRARSGQPQAQRLSLKVTELLTETMTSLAKMDEAGLAAATTQSSAVPPTVQEWLDDLLGRVDTYRDGALALLAYVVANGSIMDITAPVEGRRSVGARNADLLERLNISCRKDPFQTIAKGSATLVGRDRQPWNQLLLWASRDATFKEVRASFSYLAAGIAKTARHVPPMPGLDVQRLTFPNVAALFDDMFTTPSGEPTSNLFSQRSSTPGSLTTIIVGSSRNRSTRRTRAAECLVMCNSSTDKRW